MRIVIVFLLWGFFFMPQKVFSQPAGAPFPGGTDDSFNSSGSGRPDTLPRTMQTPQETTSPMAQPPIGGTASTGQSPNTVQNTQSPQSVSNAQTTKSSPDASGGTPAAAGSTKSSTDTGEAKDQSADQQTPFVEIKKLPAEANLYSLELRNVDLADLFRIVAHDYKLNILIDKDIKGTVTASLSNISLEEALDQIAKMNNVILEKQGNVLLVKSRVITKIFVLKNIDARVILGEEPADGGSSGGGASGSTGGAASSGSTGGSAGGSTGGSTGGSAGASTSGSSGSQSSGGSSQGPSQASTIYNLLSSDGKIFLGDQPNSLMVIDFPVNIEKIEAYLNMADQAAVDKKEVVSKVFKLKYINARDMVIEKTEDKEESSSGTSTEASSAEAGASTAGGESTGTE